MTTRAIFLPLCALLATGVIAGCGDSDTVSESDVAGGNTVTGDFKLVPDPPAGFDDVAGTATLVRNDGGTDASIELSGLKPNVKYASHVHAGACDQADPGGPHFKFAVDGGDKPPNEIHLPFTSDAEGNGTMKAHNDTQVPAGEAGAIVVHRAAAEGDAKIACAPLDKQGQAEAGAVSDTTPDDSKQDETKASGGAKKLAITVKGGKPVDGVQSLEVNKGDRVQFTVASDEAHEIHAHAYDISKDAGPGKAARFDFPASIEGVFEVEIEDTSTQILKLTVNP